MRDQYIPDMTERFPEGLDGVDMYQSYDPEEQMWNSMQDEYNDYLQEIIDNIQSYPDDELQRIYEDERSGYEGMDLDDYKDDMSVKLIRAIENEWDRRQSERESAPKSHFIAWYNDSNNAEGEDQYEIYQAADLEDAINLARADIGDALLDVEPYEP